MVKKLIILITIIMTLTGCTTLTTHEMYVTNIVYNEDVDTTTITAYFLEMDMEYQTTITGNEFEINEEGYICVLFINSPWVNDEDYIKLKELGDCD